MLGSRRPAGGLGGALGKRLGRNGGGDERDVQSPVEYGHWAVDAAEASGRRQVAWKEDRTDVYDPRASASIY
jgi:hypothetical protein